MVALGSLTAQGSTDDRGKTVSLRLAHRNAQGIYYYGQAGGKDREHYHSAEDGRFFMASLLDACGWEGGVGTGEADRRKKMEHGRTVMGPKLVTALIYDWDTREKVKVQLNEHQIPAKILYFTT